MELVVLQVIFMVVFFLVTFSCLMLPLWLFPRDPAKQTGLRSPRAMSFANCMSGGIFLGVCFVGLLPFVREKFDMIWQQMELGMRYPVTELGVVLGFFLMLLIEQAVHTWQDSKQGSAEMEAMLTFPNEYILYESEYTEDDSDCDEEMELATDQLLSSSQFKQIPAATNGPASKPDVANENGLNKAAEDAKPPKGRRSRSSSRSRSRSGRPQQVVGSQSSLASSSSSHGHSHAALDWSQGRLRCAILMLALSIHALFEGMALGLQEKQDKLVSLYVAVIIHEALVALAMGISLTKRHLPVATCVKLAVAFSVMIPAGMGIGLAIVNAQDSIAGDIVSAVIQALATGTFIYVVFLEILPSEINTGTDRLLKVLFLFLGFAFIACLRIAVRDG